MLNVTILSRPAMVVACGQEPYPGWTEFRSESLRSEGEQSTTI
jgi:hypothetical protein